MTKSKQNRLRRIFKRKYDSEKYFARGMTKSNCHTQTVLTSTGRSCILMSQAKSPTVYAKSKGGQMQFFGRTIEPFE